MPLNKETKVSQGEKFSSDHRLKRKFELLPTRLKFAL